MVLHRIVLVGALLLAASGCSAGAGGPATGDLAPEEHGVEVRVRNGTAVPLRILALHGGHETPLGRVGALEDRRVRLPVTSGTVRFVARPSVDTAVTDRLHVTEPVAIVEGQRVTWELRASPGVSDLPRMSTVRVLPCAQTGC